MDSGVQGGGAKSLTQQITTLVEGEEYTQGTYVRIPTGADFQKIWTYLGLPTISLPLLTGENDLPLGVQLIGDKLDDLRFLGTANWLEKNCKDE